jgi:AcrR family transcriptional regulator
VGRRRQIDKVTVIEMARAIANEDGIEAVSMHSVARLLGVTPMALYRHVYDKSALLDGIVGHVYGDIVPPEPDLPWRDRILAAGASIRDAAQRNPGVAVLLAQRKPPPGSSFHVDAAIADALAEGGAPRSEIIRLYRVITSAYLGQARRARRRFRRSPVNGGPAAGRGRAVRPPARRPVPEEPTHPLNGPATWSGKQPGSLRTGSGA